MSQPRYQIHHELYNFDKTKLTKYIKPQYYHDVKVANLAAEKLFHDLCCDGEVVRVIETREGGMKVQGAYASKENVYSAYTRIVRAEEETQQTGESASSVEADEEKK
jgi:hypothetical protein